MTLDYILENVKPGKKFSLMESCPESVSVSEKGGFYIRPSLTDLHLTMDCRLILFSAPGATGKSALAAYISCVKNALLWDLSKERIANHSLSGMLVEALGTKFFSEFTDGLNTGRAVLVIDALDEADMISGRIAIETLLSDLRTIIKEAKSPTVILCARTETAQMIRNFYENKEHWLPVSQYEIGFFEEHNAKEFVKTRIAGHRPVTPAIIECIEAQFGQIRRILKNEELIRSFIGYAPVLEALSIFFEEESNTMQLIRQTESAKNSTEIFVKIMEHILEREQKKVENGFRTRCEKEYPQFHDWDVVYSPEEQMIRLAGYLLFGASDIDLYPLSMPNELRSEYEQILQSFLADHPFLHTYERQGETRADFTGPAFRDYVLAKLMTLEEYEDFTKSYFSETAGQSRVPSQLFFDFYMFFSRGRLRGSHFPYLYDAFKAKETDDTFSDVLAEQVDEEIYVTFAQYLLREGREPVQRVLAEFVMPACGEELCISQLNNGCIDVEVPVVLGVKGSDVVISNSRIRCKQLVARASHIMLTAGKGRTTGIVCSDGIEAPPDFKVDIRVDHPGLLRVSLPDINHWYKLIPYSYSFEDESDLDMEKFENAMRGILKYFRKHGKDAPGRHHEFIQNVIVGNSALKQSIFNFLRDRKIIYKDEKDLSQLKLNTGLSEQFGINWGNPSLTMSPGMQSLFEAYHTWEKDGTE